ncbi:MAG: isoprenylcysteine carboxylmethyltransferase family protein [Acidobacteria bacterium]|nr:isoprenylcysteine carboxylmethyltransferase family protein [Acidobacteriota bacterium]
MIGENWIYVAAIYVPLMASLAARLLNGRRPRQFAACLLSTLWVAASLPLLQLHPWSRWWTFANARPAFGGMALALYVGWVLLWGTLPPLAFPRMRLPWVLAIMIGVDLLAMPLLYPALFLEPSWLVGELVAVAFIFVPALFISRWTLEDSCVRGRAMLQVATAGLVFLFLLPEIVFALRPGLGWKPLLSLPSWLRQMSLQAVFLLAVPGVSAVLEFAERGGGTPIPYDAPKRLVTSGVYRYVANPMQLSCGIVLLAWAALLRNWWFAGIAAMSIVYSAGIAEWDEGHDLRRRFGAEWTNYRAEVHRWFPRWRPVADAKSARLYMAESCGPCSEARHWIEARKPIGLEIIAAETLPQGSISRMRYVPGDGSAPVDGVRAMARVLEHLHLGWAYCGALLRLPIIWVFVQVVMDAAGFGPRSIVARKACSNTKDESAAGLWS